MDEFTLSCYHLGIMHFAWQRLKFEFTALETVVFPHLIAANVLRGALGLLSRKLVCPDSCPGTHQCPRDGQCLYTRTFEPKPAVEMPSGLADVPKPFVFRAAHLDGRTIAPGQNFHFFLHLFTRDPEVPPHLRATFASLEADGLGPTRGRVRLNRLTASQEACPLEIPAHPVSQIHVDFLTPTELKSGGKLVEEPHFPALFARIRDRISTLQMLYGEAPFTFDFRALADRVADVQLTSCRTNHTGIRRRSTRTGQVHDLGGFTGSAVYTGDLTEALPWLRAAQYTGVGRQSVWGKGEILVTDI